MLNINYYLIVVEVSPFGVFGLVIVLPVLRSLNWRILMYLNLLDTVSRGRWGNVVMRGKAVFCYYRKTKNGKKLLLGQQLQLTIKQIGTKMDNMAFLDSEIIIVIGFSHV